MCLFKRLYVFDSAVEYFIAYGTQPKQLELCAFALKGEHSVYSLVPNIAVCMYTYILTKSEFISSCSRPAVGSNIVQITRVTLFVNVFFLDGRPKITLYRISYHFRSIPQFLF